MAKVKYSKNTSTNLPEDAYVAWSNNIASKRNALVTMTKAVDEYQAIERVRAHNYRDFSDLQTNVSGRPGLTRQDYEYFRDNEAIPTTHKGIIAAADNAYQKVGLIRNIIDLMSDFACQGIRLVHPNKKIEKFHHNWFERVNGEDRSERFLNNIYRLAQVIVHKQTAKLTLDHRADIQKSIAQPDIKIEKINIEKNTIPWKYTFLNPSVIEVVGGPLAFFVGQPLYAIKLPTNLRRLINNATDGVEKKLVNKLPNKIVEAAKTNGSVILDPDKVSVYYYKKDDWQSWAYPMIYAILADIILLNKLKLADMAALDGAISNIRIFKLGSLEQRIAPAPAAISKLAAILQSNVGAGTIDLIWGPDIELIESKTSVHQFLGEEKYKPTLNNIYAGLGIPPTLTGTFGAAGTTNNFISLKTLTQRLEYGRNVLLDFWNKELALIQKAMGFRFPAQVEFDRTNLSDEDAEKSLLIQLADRNLISDELLQRRFKHNPDLEKIRLNREGRERKSGRMVNKSGPYHDPQFEIALKKIALQTGIVSPSEVGLQLDSRKKGEKSALMLKQQKISKEPIADEKSGQPQQGRPKNSRDKEKRKEKEFKPQTNAELLQIWATDAQEVIAKYLNSVVLSYFKKKNMRSLTLDENDKAEFIKFSVLYYLNPMSMVTHESIDEALSCGNLPKNIYNEYKVIAKYISNQLDRKLTTEELRQIQILVYIKYKE